MLKKIIYKYEYIFLEPMGFKGPSFPSDASTFTVNVPQNDTIALTCEAQAYPVPYFR